jgi:hypothetical protein
VVVWDVDNEMQKLQLQVEFSPSKQVISLKTATVFSVLFLSLSLLSLSLSLYVSLFLSLVHLSGKLK